MDHVAIMNPRLGLIERIVSGEKVIESRWYKNKTLPWNKIHSGEIVYFKDSGGPIWAVAEVQKVMQIENLDAKAVDWITKEYGGVGGINIQDWNSVSGLKQKRYCILIWLRNPRKIEPLKINKKGFGSGAAWLCIEDINQIRLPQS